LVPPSKPRHRKTWSATDQWRPPRDRFRAVAQARSLSHGYRHPQPKGLGLIHIVRLHTRGAARWRACCQARKHHQLQAAGTGMPYGSVNMPLGRGHDLPDATTERATRVDCQDTRGAITNDAEVVAGGPCQRVAAGELPRVPIPEKSTPPRLDDPVFCRRRESITRRDKRTCARLGARQHRLPAPASEGRGRARRTD
jgi:hypothetical protein